MVFRSEFGQGCERSCHLNNRSRIESNIAVEVGINGSTVQGLDQDSLRVQAEPSQGKAVNVVCSGDRQRPFGGGRANVGVGRSRCCPSVLSVNRAEQQQNRTS